MFALGSNPQNLGEQATVGFPLSHQVANNTICSLSLIRLPTTPFVPSLPSGCQQHHLLRYAQKLSAIYCQVHDSHIRTCSVSVGGTPSLPGTASPAGPPSPRRPFANDTLTSPANAAEPPVGHPPAAGTGPPAWPSCNAVGTGPPAKNCCIAVEAPRVSSWSSGWPGW